MSFNDQLIQSIETQGSSVCVGLDSRYDLLPSFIKSGVSVSEAIFSFNKEIISSTHKYAAAYKSNVSFYAAFGQEGLEALQLTNTFLKENFPRIPRLADCKRSEMGESVNMVKMEIFDWLNFNCVMVTPWFGFDTVKDYLQDDSRGVCVYVHDSNPSAPELQGLKLENGQFLYEYLCDQIVHKWNVSKNIFIEVGATYPEALRNSRKIVGDDMVILTAGVGKQGGKIEDLKGQFGTNNARFLVNSSRGIIFAGKEKSTSKEYFDEVSKTALALRDELLTIAE